MRFWKLGLALAPLALGGCGGASSGGNIPDSGVIAFASDRDGNSEIYTMAPDGSNPTRLTNNDEVDTRPGLSADRTSLLFESSRGIADALKARKTGATHNAGTIGPFHTLAGSNIWSLDLRAANPEASARQLTSSNVDFAPVWSRNGQRIVFNSERDGNSEIYTMNADGSSPTRLTTNDATDRDPDFNPDGSKIVFASNRTNIAAFYDIWMVNADGSGAPQRLTSGSGSNLGPVFSPDGTHIAFLSTRSGNTDIWLMDADGANLRQITTSATSDRFPAWSPDGRKIVFYSDRTGSEEIWKVDVAAGTETQLTNNASEEDYPDWR